MDFSYAGFKDSIHLEIKIDEWEKVKVIPYNSKWGIIYLLKDGFNSHKWFIEYEDLLISLLPLSIDETPTIGTYIDLNFKDFLNNKIFRVLEERNKFLVTNKGLLSKKFRRLEIDSLDVKVTGYLEYINSLEIEKFIQELNEDALIILDTFILYKGRIYKADNFSNLSSNKCMNLCRARVKNLGSTWFYYPEYEVGEVHLLEPLTDKQSLALGILKSLRIESHYILKLYMIYLYIGNEECQGDINAITKKIMNHGITSVNIDVFKKYLDTFEFKTTLCKNINYEIYRRAFEYGGHDGETFNFRRC